LELKLALLPIDDQIYLDEPYLSIRWRCGRLEISHPLRSLSIPQTHGDRESPGRLVAEGLGFEPRIGLHL